MDGFLITGGHDVYPPSYGERVSGTCGILSPKRDRQDIAVVRYVLEDSDKPLLGICRGIQVMNVAGGGTLYQDLEQDAGALRHDLTMGPINEPVHTVELEPDSILYRIYGNRSLFVNSFHHQSVRKIAEGYRQTARSADGVIEAIERTGSRFAVGVQWHPKMMYDSEEQKKLFRYFIGMCNSDSYGKK